MGATAKVRVTVQIDISQGWSDEATIGSITQRASAEAKGLFHCPEALQREITAGRVRLLSDSIQVETVIVPGAAR